MCAYVYMCVCECVYEYVSVCMNMCVCECVNEYVSVCTYRVLKVIFIIACKQLIQASICSDNKSHVYSDNVQALMMFYIYSSDRALYSSYFIVLMKLSYKRAKADVHLLIEIVIETTSKPIHCQQNKTTLVTLQYHSL